MKLPDPFIARVDRRKLKEYLLSAEHPIGRAKGRFFRALGFDESTLPSLEQGLLAIGRTGKLVANVKSPFGTKYLVDGALSPLAGARVKVRTIWIVETGSTDLCFVTAYPAKSERKISK